MEIVLTEPIYPSKVYELIKKEVAGSVVFHFGIVKGNVTLEFQATGNVDEELGTIADDIRRRWNIEDLLIIQRPGQLDTGDIICIVAISSIHRENAFEACHYGVDRLKKMVTIGLKETPK